MKKELYRSEMNQELYIKKLNDYFHDIDNPSTNFVHIYFVSIFTIHIYSSSNLVLQSMHLLKLRFSNLSGPQSIKSCLFILSLYFCTGIISFQFCSHDQKSHLVFHLQFESNLFVFCIFEQGPWQCNNFSRHQTKYIGAISSSQLQKLKFYQTRQLNFFHAVTLAVSTPISELSEFYFKIAFDFRSRLNQR